MENMVFFKFSVYRARSVSQRTPEFAVLITAISVSHRLQKKRPAIADLTLYMAGVAGVEPTSTVLETVVLPLNYTPKCLLIIASKKTEFNTEMKKI